jgi:putative nucleotidyltransferase with HDIG domain
VAPTPAGREPLPEIAPARAGEANGRPPPPEPALGMPLPKPTGAAREVAAYTRVPFVPLAQPALRARTLQSLTRLQQIPSLQSLAQGFLRAAMRGDGALDEVVAAVEKDPALCVRVLRMANSAFISPERRIDDIATAVQMLGLRRVNTLAHAIFTLCEARNTSGGVDWRHLWIHALATAAIAEEIEKQLGRELGPQLYLAALLHDVGKIVLSTVEPETYRALLDQVWAGDSRIDALEAAAFGVTHDEAGVIFAQQSGLPSEVISTIAYHANPLPAESHRLTVAVVSIANYLSKFYGLGFSGSRLDETDGDLEAQPGWGVIAEELGAMPDVPAIAEAIRASIGDLKQELQGLREAA